MLDHLLQIGVVARQHSVIFSGLPMRGDRAVDMAADQADDVCSSVQTGGEALHLWLVLIGSVFIHAMPTLIGGRQDRKVL